VKEAKTVDKEITDENTDEVFSLIKKEKARQKKVLRLIPSENYISPEVATALASCFGNKYSEGYAGKRYYQGLEFVDQLELLTKERAQKLFKVPHANVQPYSGSIANAAVYFGLLEPGDTIMGMALDSGGHLTHGFPKITFSGKYFNSISYIVGEDGLLNYEKVRELALQHKPKLLISGASAYPRKIDFSKFGEIADKVSAYHMADISHIAGLVATGEHVSPVEFADVITTTTHKTLRGPRGAMVLVTEKGLKKDPDLAKKIDKAVFPGMQGGPHNNTIAGLAVCLGEALSPEFDAYIKQVILNACTLAEGLLSRGFNLVTGGTDNHLLLIDLRNKNLDGWILAWALEFAGIIVNRNAIPFDPNPPFYPSGIRLGTPAITSLGLKEDSMDKIAQWIDDVAKIAQEHVDKLGVPLKDLDKKMRQSLKEDFSRDKKILEIAQEVEKLLHD
jgi:glycine hydroxymethyltransferase